MLHQYVLLPLLLACVSCSATSNSDSGPFELSRSWCGLEESESQEFWRLVAFPNAEPAHLRDARLRKWVAYPVTVCFNPNHPPGSSHTGWLKDFVSLVNSLVGFQLLGLAESTTLCQVVISVDRSGHLRYSEDLPVDRELRFPMLSGYAWYYFEGEAFASSVVAIATDKLGYPGSDRYLLQHELLHALGFRGHPEDLDSILNQRSLRVTSLTELDRKWLRLLYHPRTRAGATLSEMNSLFSEAQTNNVCAESTAADSVPPGYEESIIPTK